MTYHQQGPPALPPRAIRWMRATGAVAIATGMLVIAGWIFDLTLLKSVLPGLVTMKFNTAVAFTLVGAALVSASSGRPAVRTASTMLAASAALIALVSISQSWLGYEAGIDEFFFRDATAVTLHPGRMAQPTGAGLMVVAAAVVMLRARQRARLVLSFMAAAIACFAWLNVIGYFYNVTTLMTPTTRVPMALHTSALLGLLLGIAAVVLARDQWAEVLFADSPAADAARRLVPVALLLPVFLGWFRKRGEDLGLYDGAMGVAIFALLFVMILVALVLRFAHQLHRDTEARRGVERELQRTSARLSTVFDSVGHAVFVITGNGNLVVFSRTAERMTGVSAADASGRHVVSLHAAAEQEDALRWYEEVVSAGGSAEREWLWMRADGSTLDVRITLNPVQDGSGDIDGFVGVAADITARKEADRVINEARVAAEEANRQKSRFLANMSHELRTPLNGIIGFAYLLRQTTGGGLTPDQLRHVSVIETSARHLLQLINDILDLSKIESGKFTPEIAMVDVEATIEGCRGVVAATAAEKGVVIEIERPSAPLLVAGDEKMLRQIMLNLLSNAVKFTPAGGRVTVSISAATPRRVSLRVSDTGIGIDPADHMRIFSAFEQVDTHYSRDQEGTGLGLTLTKKLVELQGGTIRVESKGSGRGSTFIVELPEWQPIASAAFDEKAFAEGDGPLILVGEDDAASREIIARALASGGYRVVFAATTTQLVRMARELSPSAITLDIVMPPDNGWEALRQLKEDDVTRQLPVVVISIVEERMLAFSLGASDYLVKPVDPSDVRRTVERLLEGDRERRRILVVDDDPAVRERASTASRRESPASTRCSAAKGSTAGTRC